MKVYKYLIVLPSDLEKKKARYFFDGDTGEYLQWKDCAVRSPQYQPTNPVHFATITLPNNVIIGSSHTFCKRETRNKTLSIPGGKVWSCLDIVPILSDDPTDYTFNFIAEGFIVNFI